MHLNKQQQQAVDSSSHCLVVACPGSGKTSLIVQKVKRLLLADEKVGVVTFTRDAAEEVKHRIKQILTKELGEDTSKRLMRRVVTGTFHSLCMRMLKTANLLGHLVSPIEQRQYVERALYSVMDDKIAMERYSLRKIVPDFEYASKEIEHYKCSLNFVSGKLPPKAAAPIFHRYIEILSDNKVIDFSDLITNAVHQIQNGSIKPIPVTYMLVDEFQDTDEVQLAWVLEHVKAGTKVTVVGDDDQSIYAFRRALGFAGMQTFQRATNAETVMLPVNYRCRREILNAASAVVKNNIDRMDKSLHAHRGEGGKIKTVAVGSDNDLAQCLVEDMQADLLSCTDDLRFTHTVKPGSWAVLARTNQQLMDLSKKLWEQPQRVKHFLGSGSSPWDSDPLCFLVALLESIETLRPDGIDLALAWAGVLDTDLSILHRKLGSQFSSKMLSGKDIPYDDLNPGSASLLRQFNKVSSSWGPRYAEGRTNLVATGVNAWMTGVLEAKLADQPKRSIVLQRGLDSLKSADQLLEKIEDSSFVKRFAILRAKPDKDDRDRGLVLLTLHSCKGLEFDNVWIIGSEDDMVPGAKLEVPVGLDSDDPPDVVIQQNLESERRLYYVGMTRAKNNLVVSWETGSSPSRFVREAGLIGS